MKKLLLTLLSLTSFCLAEEVRKPNFIIIFTDDQGYGDLGCYGSKDAVTPRIDQMAAEGLKLTSFYVSAPYCTPSRASLMTGCYARRVGMGGGVNLSADPKGLNPEEVTIAEVLKAAGYKTGMFGKWHLGDQPEFLPTRQGFDEFYGLPYSHDIHPFNPKNSPKRSFPPLPLLEGEKVIQLEPNADFLTRNFTQRAVKFIHENKDSPFFLYLPHPLPHRPIHTAPEYLENIPAEYKKALAEEKKTGKINYDVRDKLYFQGIAEIDWSVGEVLDALKENGIEENTLVIFTSDNGQARPPHGIGTAHPLSGAKGMTLEGGLRVPSIIRYPDKIKPGTEYSQIITAMDLLPTFAHLAGAEEHLPRDRIIDGKNVTTSILDGADSPHEDFFYHRVGKLKCVRSGPWKLHLTGSKLYNLETDIGEKINVAADHPEIVKKLKVKAQAFDKNIKAHSRPAGKVSKPKTLGLSD